MQVSIAPFGHEFSPLSGEVIAEILNAIHTSELQNLIRGSLMVSLGILGLSLLDLPFWPDLKLVCFQRLVPGFHLAVATRAG